MTERIYYTGPERCVFDAVVVRSMEHEGRPAAVLDRTAFYPTSGGQPFDTGVLGDAGVVDVVEANDDIIHVLTAPLAVGAMVHGTVDWARRFDHMQQHTGQHVLSAAFERSADVPTVSFHMGTETSTIDLAREVDAAAIAGAEDAANAVVFDDRAVSIRFVTREEAAGLPLRKESLREGTLRLIDIPDFDLSACGGTHVARTGAIGLIVVLGAERFKGGTRITFACGGRSLRALRALRDVVIDGTRLLSVTPGELPQAIGRLQAEARDQRKALKAMGETLARYEGVALLDGAPLIRGVSVVVRVDQDRDVAGLKAMASAAVRDVPAVVALLTTAPPGQVVIARSPGVQLDAAAILRQLVSRFGGKGGGTPEVAQGGGLTGDVRAIEWALTGFIEDVLQTPSPGDAGR